MSSGGYFGGGNAGGACGDAFSDPGRLGIAIGADGLGCEEEVVDVGCPVGERGVGVFEMRRE